MSSYDPGEPYDGPPPRRRRHDYRRESEYDDAWAAANEEALDSGDLSADDLAAGYVWEDRDRYGVEHADYDDTNAPPSPHRAHRSRRSPTYYRDRAKRGEYAEYWDTPQPAPRRPAARSRTAAPGRGLPYWQVLLLVTLLVLAVLAMTLACVSVLVLL